MLAFLKAHSLAFATLVVSAACTPMFMGCGACLIRLDTGSGSRCVVDSCPKNSKLDERVGRCACTPGLMPVDGACLSIAEASATCGTGYTYAAGRGCVAKTCPAGQIFNGATARCESRASSDAAVASAAGLTLGAGKTVGCSPGFTYVVSGTEGSCIPNEFTCGPGTRWDGATCATVTCGPGFVGDPTSGGCTKLSRGDEKVYSVTTKLKSSLSASFCAPFAKNPTAFKVTPGGSLTVKVTLTVNVPGNDIASAGVGLLAITNGASGSELNAGMFPGVTSIRKQIDETIVPSIRALGGKSEEGAATADVVCTIRRAPIAVVETSAGGI